jgi:DNA-binding PadR family transcriptional regulator
MHCNHHFFSERDERGRPHRRGGYGFGGWGRGFRGGGPGVRAAKMLASGDLQLIILLLLQEKPRHGYEIIKAIEEHSSGIYVPSPGMVYPALTYLEEMSYAAATVEGTKKLYSLTDAGAEYFANNRGAAEEVWNQLALFGRRYAQFQKQFAEDEDVAENFGSDPRGRARSEWHQLKAEFRELRDELKSAIFEKLDASMAEKKRILDILRRTIDEIRGK